MKKVMLLVLVYALCGGAIAYSRPNIMEFDYRESRSSRNTIPPVIVGYWTIGNALFEFRNNGRYFVLDQNRPYQLLESGMILVHAGTRFTRQFGDPGSLPGVWLLESDPTEEWNLRSDGTYTYHWSGFELFGEYTFDATTMSTSEMRAVLSESAGTLTFDPPYALSVSGTWSITEPKLTVSFPSGDVVYTRVPEGN